MSDQRTTVIVIAKAPVAGQVKTRLSPPLSPAGAAEVAAASIADTLDNVRAVVGVRRVLAYAGDRGQMLACGTEGFELIAQRGTRFAARLAHAFVDAQTACPGRTVLIGMDTPQATAQLIGAAIEQLRTSQGVIGPAIDGGWWLLGLANPSAASALREVPMSTAETGRLTRAALQERGIVVQNTSTLRDVDTIDDARAVADLIPRSTFALTLERMATPSIRR